MWKCDYATQKKIKYKRRMNIGEVLRIPSNEGNMNNVTLK